MIGAHETASSANRLSSHRSTSQKLTLLDYIVIVTVTFPVLGTFYPFETYVNIGNVAEATSDGSLSGPLMILWLSGFLAFLFLKSPSVAIGMLRRGWPILLFAVWCFITSRWSYSPGASFNRTLRVFLIALMAMYIIEYYDTRKSIKIVFLALILSQLLSICAIVLLPNLALQIDARVSWRGAMIHKNSLGILTAIGAAFSVYLYISSKRVVRKYYLLAGGLSFTLLLLSNSASSFSALIVSAAVLSYLYYFASGSATDRAKTVFLGMTLAVIGAVLAEFASPILFDLLERSSNLTGRGPVWQFVDYMIARNPIWGYGHGVWSDPDFKLLALDALNWLPAHAHSTWRDMWLQLGIPGLGIFVLIWSTAVKNAFVASTKSTDKALALYVGLLVLFSMRSYAETIVAYPAYTEIFWVALFYFGLSRAAGTVAILPATHDTSSPAHVDIYRRVRRANASI